MFARIGNNIINTDLVTRVERRDAAADLKPIGAKPRPVVTLYFVGGGCLDFADEEHAELAWGLFDKVE